MDAKLFAEILNQFINLYPDQTVKFRIDPVTVTLPDGTEICIKLKPEGLRFELWDSRSANEDWGPATVIIPSVTSAGDPDPMFIYVPDGTHQRVVPEMERRIADHNRRIDDHNRRSGITIDDSLTE